MRVAHNKLTIEEKERRIKEVFGDKLEIIEIRDKEVTVKSNICGHTFTKKYHNLLKRKPVCTSCSRKDRSNLHLSKEEFLQRYPKFDKEYEILGEWKTSQVKTLIKHKACGGVREVRPYYIATKDVDCPICTTKGKTFYNTIIVNQLLENTDFELIGECSMAKEEATFKHKKCGKTFTKKATSLLKSHSCPYCIVKSNGEERISQILDKYNINYKRECAFKDLRGLNGGYLRYDFGILDDNGLNYFIEYDGEQHFKEKSVEFFRDDLSKIQAHDKIKTDYCNNKGYTLLRIPYTDYENIETIVVNFLNKNKLIPSQAS